MNLKAPMFSRRTSAALGLAFVLAAAGPALGQASDTFPKTPFDGLQITYSISGVDVEAPEDAFGFKVTRALSGKVTGGKIVLTVSVAASGGLGGSVAVRVVGDKGEVRFHQPVPPKQAVTLDPIQITAGGTDPVSFEIDLAGKYSMGNRSVEVSGSFAGLPKKKPTPPLPQPPAKKDIEIKITGAISDAAGRPMPHLWMTAKSILTKESEVRVGEDGRYEVRIKIPDPSPDAASRKVKFKLLLSYRKDGTEWYKLVRFPAPAQVPGAIVAALDIEADPSRPDMTQDVSFQAMGGLKTNIGDLEALRRASVIYADYHDAVKFAREKLKVTLGPYAPLTVQVGSDKPTRFDYLNQMIRLEEQHTKISDPTTLFVQHHEFGHYIHYVGRGGRWYGGQQGDDNDPENRTHGGYANDDTADSMMEGFATFFAALVARFKDKPAAQPSVIGTYGDLATGYVPWDHEGRDEEFAFAAVMWDLVDRVGLDYASIWTYLKHPLIESFGVVYERLVRDFSSKKAEIDAAFRNHGVYALKRPGNGRYDVGEAFFDMNSNGTLDAGERFIDYSIGQDGKNDMAVRGKDDVIVGRSANYQRIGVELDQKVWKERYSTFRFGNAHLKIAGGSAEALKIKIVYPGGAPPYEVTAPVDNGRIAVPLLPSSVKADFLVLPVTAAGDAEAVYRSTTGDVERNFWATRGADSLDTVTLPPSITAPLPLSGEVSPPGDDEDFALPAATAAPAAQPTMPTGTGGGGGGVPSGETGGISPLLIVGAAAVLLALMAAILGIVVRRRRTGASDREARISATVHVVLPDGRRLDFPVRENRTTIGRDSGNALVIDDPLISARHAEIVVDGGMFLIRDAGSSNGTFLNGAAVVESPIHRGDEIVIGSTTLTFDD